MDNIPHISAVINVRNEADNLIKCLKNIRKFADEIIVIDMESTDNSVEVAKSEGCKVYNHPWLPVVEPARNFGLSKAKGEWIILLDPDERLIKSLRQELKKISNRNDVDFVRIPRKNIIFKKWLKYGKMWPDYLIRFFRKGKVTWKSEIHSQPVTTGTGITLIDSPDFAIKHLNYQSVIDFLYKAIRYSQKSAKEMYLSGYKVKISDFILKPIQEFNSRFFSNSGYKDGIHGLIFSLLQACVELLNYVFLWELEGSSEKVLTKESFVSATQQSTYEFGHWFTKYIFWEYTKNPLTLLLYKLRQLLNRITKNL